MNTGDRESFAASPNTGYDKKKLAAIGKKISTLPANKQFIKKTTRLIDNRTKQIEEGTKLSWDAGELLAYGSLLEEGHAIRFYRTRC